MAIWASDKRKQREAEQAKLEAEPHCKWTYLIEEDTWKTACGHEIPDIFTSASQKTCNRCGLPILHYAMEWKRI